MPRIWGARSLAPIYPEKINLPEPIGEAWLTGPQCLIETGDQQGRTLSELAAEVNKVKTRDYLLTTAINNSVNPPLSIPHFNVNINCASPETARSGTDCQLTLYLLHVGRDPFWRNAPLDGPRHIWWNFVSSSKERIEQAKADWKEGRFAKVPGDKEFIPLPDK